MVTVGCGKEGKLLPEGCLELSEDIPSEKNDIDIKKRFGLGQTRLNMTQRLFEILQKESRST